MSGAHKNSWCVAASYVCPEIERKKYRTALSKLKNSENVHIQEEIKLHQISENNYIQFLKRLGELKGVLFCVATDSGLNTKHLVEQHQIIQVASIRSYVDKMHYEGGVKAMTLLSAQLEKLPPQLYIQLHIQVSLVHAIIRRGINFFVQRNPNSLQQFRWRIDQKLPNAKTDFEDAFEKMCPALLQTFSIKQPSALLDWCDYRPMKKYWIEEGGIPDYLTNEFPQLKTREGLDLQKIVRGDMKFDDSKSCLGIQVADLLASGVRRLLRQEFENNEIIAHHLGGLLVQKERGAPPISFKTFGKEEHYLDDSVAGLVNIMTESCRPMFYKKGPTAFE